MRRSRRSAMLGAGATGLSLLLGNLMTTANAASSSQPRHSSPPALLDHLVWLAGDLDAACAQFEAMSGVKPIYGGAHPSGTHNALVGLGERVYLEIAAPVPGAEAGHPWVDAARHRPEPHLYSYCMRSERTLEMLADEAKGAGIAAFGPSKGSRTTPEGKTLEWQLLIPIMPDAGGVIPFLIDWQDTPHPAQTSPSAVSLIGFEAEHPKPESLGGAMAMLAPGVRLTQSERRPGLAAQLSTPRGPLTLSS